MAVLVAFHLVGVVLWMGTLLALSRVMVVHASEPPNVRPRFSHLERRLDAFGALPGAIVTLATGLAQIALEPRGYFARAAWLHWKLVLVAGAAVVHVAIARAHRRMASDRADAPVARGRLAALHGTLGLLLIAIVLLAELRPMSSP